MGPCLGSALSPGSARDLRLSLYASRCLRTRLARLSRCPTISSEQMSLVERELAYVQAQERRLRTLLAECA